MAPALRRASRAARSVALSPVASATMVATPSVSRRDRIRPASGSSSRPASASSLLIAAPLVAFSTGGTVFWATPPYYGGMTIFSGWAARGRALFSDNKGPWGAPPGGGGSEPPEEPAGGPWGEPPKRGRPAKGAPVTSLDEFLQRSRTRLGGGPGGGFGFGGRPNGSILVWAV